MPNSFVNDVFLMTGPPAPDVWGNTVHRHRQLKLFSADIYLAWGNSFHHSSSSIRSKALHTETTKIACCHSNNASRNKDLRKTIAEEFCPENLETGNTPDFGLFLAVGESVHKSTSIVRRRQTNSNYKTYVRSVIMALTSSLSWSSVSSSWRRLLSCAFLSFSLFISLHCSSSSSIFKKCQTTGEIVSFLKVWGRSRLMWTSIAPPSTGKRGQI